MSKKVDQDTVRKVAGIARLRLTDEEIEKFSGDLSDVLEAFKVLQEINTKGVEPSFRPITVSNVLREDRIEPSLPRNKLLRNLKNKEDGFIKGPRVV